MYTVATPDPDPDPNRVNYLTLRVQFYANEGETLTPNDSTLTSGTSGGTAPTYTIYTRGGGQLP